MDVHFEICFVGENPSLPVLLKVLRGDHADGLYLHGLKSERNDIVHSFYNRAPFARQWNTGRSEFNWHIFPPRETKPTSDL